MRLVTFSLTLSTFLLRSASLASLADSKRLDSSTFCSYVANASRFSLTSSSALERSARATSNSFSSTCSADNQATQGIRADIRSRDTRTICMCLSRAAAPDDCPRGGGGGWRFRDLISDTIFCLTPSDETPMVNLSLSSVSANKALPGIVSRVTYGTGRAWRELAIDAVLGKRIAYFGVYGKGCKPALHIALVPQRWMLLPAQRVYFAHDSGRKRSVLGRGLGF